MVETEKRKIVLVVDDEPRVLKFVEIDLKLRGFDVTTTGSGEEALVLLSSLNPDIVLLDMIMPGIDGCEVLRRIRANNDLPVIAFSASPANQDLAMAAGANTFLHKPFDPDIMARNIRELLK